MNDKSKKKILNWYVNLVERKRKTLKIAGISMIPWLFLVIIGFIILAVQGLIGDIPWFLYIDLKYIGYTIGISGIVLYLIRYMVHSFRYRKEIIKPPYPNFLIQMFYAILL